MSVCESERDKKPTGCGVRTHACLRIVVLKTTPLDHSGKPVSSCIFLFLISSNISQTLYLSVTMASARTILCSACVAEWRPTSTCHVWTSFRSFYPHLTVRTLLSVFRLHQFNRLVVLLRMSVINLLTLVLDASSIVVVRHLALQAPWLFTGVTFEHGLILLFLEEIVAVRIEAFRCSREARLGPFQHERVESFELWESDQLFNVRMWDDYSTLIVRACDWESRSIDLSYEEWFQAFFMIDVTAAIQGKLVFFTGKEIFVANLTSLLLFLLIQSLLHLFCAFFQYLSLL